MAHFSRAITRPDGLVPQIGDNDNGRFLNFHPGESLLCHAGLGAAVAGLFDDEAGQPLRCETGIVRALAIGSSAVTPSPAAENNRAVGAVDLRSYPRFGLFVYRTANVYLAVRCGPVGQNGHGGHAHNDQLSIELAVDGWPLVVDPGTYLYTPAPEYRNRFRSTAMHNTLSVPGREQNPWPGGAAGLFRMTDRARTMVLCCEPGRFIGEHHGFGMPCRRTLLIEGDQITGIDECPLDGPKDVWFHLAPGVVARPEEEGPGRAAAVELVAGRSRVRLEAEIGRWLVEESICSPGYGAAEPCRAVRLRSEARRIVWRFQRTGGG
jgi:hypothetical protein